MADRTIQIIVDVTDRTGGKLGSLQAQLKALDAAAQRLSERFKSLASLKYQATLSLIDRVTNPASRINSLLKRLAGGAYNIALRLNDGALGGLRRIESSLMRLSSKAYNIAVNVKGAAAQKLEGLFSGALLGAGVFAPLGLAGAGFGVGSAIQASLAFEKQMSKVQAVRQLEKDSEQMRALVEQAKDLGAQTAWTRTQVGEAQYYQALAGWQTPDILKATPHILNLASASDMDLGRASDIVTDTMTAFNLKATDTFINKQGKEVSAVAHYVDLLTKMQAVANTTVEQAGGAFKYAANIFGATSMNLHGQERVQKAMEAATDAAVMTALLANAGIKESMSGTGMSNFMQRMTSGNRNAFYALGLTDTQVEDAKHDLLPVRTIMRQISKSFHEGLDVNKLADFVEQLEGIKIHADTRRQLDKLSKDILENGGKLGTADMLQLGKMFAGAEHAQKFMALVMGDWDDMQAKLEDVNGTAAQFSEVMLDNLAGSLTRLDSAFDAFRQDLFTGTAGDGLRDFVDTLTELFSRANNLFKDGIQLSDFGKLIGEAVSRLKNKFLELDGVGSLLAGGALAGALLKIANLTRSVTNNLRGFGKGQSTLPGSQSVGTMHVSAGVVHVSGAIGRKVGNQAVIDDYYRTKERIRSTGSPPPAPSAFQGAKAAAGYAAAFQGVFALLDFFNTRDYNQARLVQAPPEERAQIIKENRQAEWQAGTAAVGSAFGAAAGAALLSVAGPFGTMLGGVLGSAIGEKAGSLLGLIGAEREAAKQVNDSTTARAADRFKVDTDWLGQDKFSFGEFADVTNTHWKKAAQVSGEVTGSLQTVNDGFKNFSTQIQDGGAFDFYKSQRESWDANSFQWQFPTAHAEAAELNEEQRAQQAAMEKPTFEPPELALEDYYSQVEAFTEGLNELFSTLGESLTESLTSSFEGIGEIFSSFGEAATESLTSTFEGVGEIFTAGMTAAQEGVTAALEGISQAFTSTKETIQSSWAELPGFFAGIFSGLGGAASAAGAAIEAGLTAPIGSVIGSWEGAAAQISAIISSISAQAAAIPAVPNVAVPAHAEGGFITHPELALIGEKGAELILPLTDKERSLDLLSQSGLLEGGAPSLNAGFNINISFNISGAEPQSIMNQIEANLEELTDKIAAQFSEKISASYHNQPLET